MRHKHLECCRQLGSSHFQSNRGELEKVLAQRRAELGSEVHKDSCIRRNWINYNSCTWKRNTSGKGWRDMIQFHKDTNEVLAISHTPAHRDAQPQYLREGLK